MPHTNPDGIAPVSTSATSDDAGSADSGPFSLDVTTVVKASQALSSEIDLETLMKKLMKILMENAGAQRGFLILESDGRLLIEARGTVDQDQVMVLESVPVEESQDLPQTIIHYAARSKAHVVISDAKKTARLQRIPIFDPGSPNPFYARPSCIHPGCSASYIWKTIS